MHFYGKIIYIIFHMQIVCIKSEIFPCYQYYVTQNNLSHIIGERGIAK